MIIFESLILKGFPRITGRQGIARKLLCLPLGKKIIAGLMFLSEQSFLKFFWERLFLLKNHSF